MFINTKKINLEGAKLLANAAREKAIEIQVPGAAAVVDDGGNLVYVERRDNSMIYAVDIVINKAKTAIGFRRPTIALEQTIDEGRSAMLGLTNTIAYAPLKGAYPIEMDGKLIGAIAVGGTLNADLDEVIVLAALKEIK